MVRVALASRSTSRSPAKAPMARSSVSRASTDAPGSMRSVSNAATRAVTCAAPRCRCTGASARNGALLLRQQPDADVEADRSARARRDAAPSRRDSPQPSTAAARPRSGRLAGPLSLSSAGRFWACRPRTRSSMPDGDSISRSSTRMRPETSVPVNTRPAPVKVKARSTASRGYWLDARVRGPSASSAACRSAMPFARDRRYRQQRRRSQRGVGQQ